MKQSAFLPAFLVFIATFLVTSLALHAFAGTMRINGGDIYMSDDGDEMTINGVNMKNSATISGNDNQVQYNNGGSSYVGGNGYSVKVDNKEGEVMIRNVDLKDVVIYQTGPDIYIQFKKK